MGGLGIYPSERRLPGGTRLRVGGGAGVCDGGNIADVGEPGSGVELLEPLSGSTYDTGVTLGANVTGRAAP